MSKSLVRHGRRVRKVHQKEKRSENRRVANGLRKMALEVSRAIR